MQCGWTKTAKLQQFINNGKWGVFTVANINGQKEGMSANRTPKVLVTDTQKEKRRKLKGQEGESISKAKNQWWDSNM